MAIQWWLMIKQNNRHMRFRTTFRMIKQNVDLMAILRVSHFTFLIFARIMAHSESAYWPSVAARHSTLSMIILSLDQFNYRQLRSSLRLVLIISQFYWWWHQNGQFFSPIPATTYFQRLKWMGRNVILRSLYKR